MKYELRDYQRKDRDKLRQCFARGDRAVLYQLSTGGGKTVVFSAVTEGAAKRGKKVLILVHRQELLRQSSETLNEIGVEHGLIAPKYTPSWSNVQVASVQTLVKRLHKVEAPDLIIADEAHHARAGSWSTIFNHFSKARILGVTATPIRLSGEGLGRESGGVFDSIVNGPPISELIRRGYLAPPRMFAPPVGVNFSKAHKRYGEFIQSEIAEEMDKPVITGCAVKHYQNICNGAPAIAFCASVAHAEHVAEQFRQAGFKAASVDGSMHDNDRKGRIAALGNGGLNVLTSCDIISEGTDIPVVAAAILLRPTASLSLCMQQIGRALRIHPGKSHAVILDHVGNVMRHNLGMLGLPEGDLEWSLDGESTRKKGKTDEESDVKIKQCEQCYAVHPPSPTCPYCGYVYQVSARELQQVEGELKELDRERLEQIEADRKRMFAKREEGKCKTLEDFQALAAQRGYNPGWAYHRYRARQQRGGGASLYA